MKYLCVNRLGALGPSGGHSEAGLVLSVIHPVSVVACTTLLPPYTLCTVRAEI